MSSAIGIISSARGFDLIDYSVLQNAPRAAQVCSEQMDSIVTVIRQRVDAVQAYNADYDSMGWGQKLLSSIGLGVAKIGEGFLGGGTSNVIGGTVTVWDSTPPVLYGPSN